MKCIIKISLMII